MDDFVESDFDFRTAKVLYSRPNKVEILLAMAKGKQYVVKKLKVHKIEEVNALLKESYAMMGLNHNSIIKIHAGLLGGHSGSFEYFLFIMDYYPDGDLATEISKRQQKDFFWTESELLEIFSDLAQGFGYMQARNLAHRDIKPQHILKSKHNKYIISDLGCAFKTNDKSSFDIAGTPNYLSPKLRQAYKTINQGCDLTDFNQNVYKSDVFSLGLTFLYMASLRDIQELGVIDEIEYSRILARRLQGVRYKTVSQILQCMLAYNEENRWDFMDLCGFFNCNPVGITTMQNSPAPIVNPPPVQNKALKIENNPVNLMQRYIPQPVSGNKSDTKGGLYQGNVLGISKFPAPMIKNSGLGYNPMKLPVYQPNIEGALRELQSYTNNVDASRIVLNQHKNRVKWTVKICKSRRLEEYIKQMAQYSLVSADMKHYKEVYCYLYEQYWIKIEIKPLRYSCKICNLACLDQYCGMINECGGYAHNACILNYSTYMLAEDIIYCGFTCIVCNSFHVIISKSLFQCIYCGVLTLNKEMIGACCLNCLSNLDASCCNFNISKILLTYQLISKISYENYRNLNGLCRSCNSIPDVFMIGQHWSCYPCIFSCMELENCIRCQYGCCYIEKKLVFESSFPVQKIDPGFSSVSVFENTGQIRDTIIRTVSPSSSVIYI